MTDPARVSRAAEWVPSAVELDDLELLLHGGYAPLRGFLGERDSASVAGTGRLADGTPWPVPITLTVPHATARAAAEHGALVVLDEEGTPVATVAVDEIWPVDELRSGVAGPVAPLAPIERRTGGPAAAHPASAEPVLGVPVRDLMHAGDVAALRAAALDHGARITLFPLVGQGMPRGTDGIALVATCLTARDELVRLGCPAIVCEVPLPRHAVAEERDRDLAARVALTQGATHVTAAWTSPGSPVRGLPTSAGAPVGATAVLFTGLSGSGKSTVAKAVQARLQRDTGRPVTLLDGDVVRRMLSSELGFSREHRELNVRRIGFVAAEIVRHGGIVLCAPIAPYADARAEVRRMVEEHGRMVLVHVSTPLEVCEARDRKGLYARARRGEIAVFTGISDPYETPLDAEVTIDTTDLTVEVAAARVLAAITGTAPREAAR